MKRLSHNLQFALAGAAIGWFGSKILNHNNWAENPIVNNMLSILIIVAFLVAVGYSFWRGSRAYKKLQKPDPSAEELVGNKPNKA